MANAEAIHPALHFTDRGMGSFEGPTQKCEGGGVGTESDVVDDVGEASVVDGHLVTVVRSSGEQQGDRYQEDEGDALDVVLEWMHGDDG
jgi:hypothetical protein